jgi:hypothetical protein
MQFPFKEFMDVLGMVYPQYCLQDDPKGKFGFHLNIIKSFYYNLQKVGLVELWVLPLLDVATIDLQIFTFVLSTNNNAQVTMAPPHLVNPLI